MNIMHPRDLDNKQFRLLTNRVILASKNKNSISATEEELLEILDSHPELLNELSEHRGLFGRQFSELEFNPFLHLAAHFEIRRQIHANRPRGIKSIFNELCEKGLNRYQAEERMAIALTRLGQIESNEDILKPEIYLKKMETFALSPNPFEIDIINDDFETNDDDESPSRAQFHSLPINGFLTPGMQSIKGNI